MGNAGWPSAVTGGLFADVKPQREKHPERGQEFCPAHQACHRLHVDGMNGKKKPQTHGRPGREAEGHGQLNREHRDQTVKKNVEPMPEGERNLKALLQPEGSRQNRTV